MLLALLFHYQSRDVVASTPSLAPRIPPPQPGKATANPATSVKSIDCRWDLNPLPGLTRTWTSHLAREPPGVHARPRCLMVFRGAGRNGQQGTVVKKDFPTIYLHLRAVNNSRVPCVSLRGRRGNCVSVIGVGLLFCPM